MERERNGERETDRGNKFWKKRRKRRKREEMGASIGVYVASPLCCQVSAKAVILIPLVAVVSHDVTLQYVYFSDFVIRNAKNTKYQAHITFRFLLSATGKRKHMRSTQLSSAYYHSTSTARTAFSRMSKNLFVALFEASGFWPLFFRK